MPSRAAVAIAVALAVLVVAPAALARPPLELHTRRGVGGVVPAGGIEVIEVEVVSAADVELAVELEVDGGRHRVALAARGRATVTLARRVPPGASTLAAIPVRAGAPLDAGAIEGAVPAVAVVARPVVVVTDDATAALPAIDRWRRDQGLGAPVAIALEAVPARWQAWVGLGALVIDRPIAAFAPAVARQIARQLAAGGTVCRLAPDEAAPRCARPAPLAVPRTRRPGSIAPAARALGAVALAVALAFALAAALPRRRRAIAPALIAVALGLGAAAPALWSPGGELAVRGVRAAAGGDEDWIAAELGASALAGRIALGGDLWIEPSVPAGAVRLDDRGLRGRVPGPGSWRVRGFVPAGAGGWTHALTRVARPAPEVP